MLLTTIAILALGAAPGDSIDVAGMDQKVRPGDDFFDYTSGTWIQKNPMPEDRARYGNLEVINDRARTQTAEVIQSAKAHAGTDPAAKRVANFYQSFMDEAGIEAKGITPIAARLAAIGKITDKRQLAFALGESLRQDVDPLNATDLYTPNLFGFFVAQGLDDPKRNVGYFLQGGLGMPDRELYLKDDEHSIGMREKYEAHLRTLLTLAKIDEAPARAVRVLELEKKIAAASATRLETGDIKKPKPWLRSMLAKQAPGLDWTQFLTAANLQKQPRFYMWQPNGIAGIAKLVGSEGLEAWKDWLTVHAIDERAAFLGKALASERFDFYGKLLQGQPKQRERSQRAVDLTSAMLGDEVGKLYVAKNFSPEAKAEIQKMVAGIIKAFGARIEKLAWMTPATKKQAVQKLKTLRVGVGYPDKWKDYDGLEIAADDIVGNIDRTELYDFRTAVAKLGKAPDRDEWWMSPQVVNAINLPLQNAIQFPAAFMQPPYFSVDADPAANYGSMGSIIGHEISHSFDDVGAEFDASGRLFNWWKPTDFKRFKRAGGALVAQYDAYEVLPGLHINGTQTLGENIADVAGLAATYDAWKAATGGTKGAVDGTMPPSGVRTAADFSADQVFFIAFAQGWREITRDALMKIIVATNGHSPEKFRALTVRNLDAWYKAFDVKLTDKLALPSEKRIQVW